MSSPVDGRITFGPDAVIRTGRIGPPDPSMTAEECVSHGGHCHEPTGMARAVSPPQHEERCKHCGHTRWAVQQPAYRYIDETGQPL